MLCIYALYAVHVHDNLHDLYQHWKFDLIVINVLGFSDISFLDIGFLYIGPFMVIYMIWVLAVYYRFLIS